MLRRNIFVLFFLLLGLPAQAQFVDDPYLYQEVYQAEVSEGIRWRRLAYDDLNGVKQIINIVEVDLKKASIKPMQTRGCKKISSLAPQKGALVAINGTFFQSNCKSRNFLKVKGKTYTKNKIRPAGSAALLIEKSGAVTMRMIGQNESPSKSYHGIGGFPQLLTNGEVALLPLEDTSFFNARHPRTAVGIQGDSKIILFTIDGRSPNSNGFSLYELARFLKNYGLKSAMNLDGGGSTALWIDSEGIVNRPSSSKGERKVSDGLGVFPIHTQQ